MVRTVAVVSEDLYTRADALMDAGERRHAFGLLLRGAEAGDLTCADRLGICFTDGEGTRRDVDAGLRWLRWAHRRGSSIAATNIAITYADNGRWRLAAKWWARSVAAGDGDDRIDLAMCFLEGLGVRRSPRRARALLLRAAAMKPTTEITPHGREWAMALLGVLSLAGLGTPVDVRSGRRWLERANADDDYTEAREALAAIRVRRPSPLDVARSNPWVRRRRG